MTSPKGKVRLTGQEFLDRFIAEMPMAFDIEESKPPVIYSHEAVAAARRAAGIGGELMEDHFPTCFCGARASQVWDSVLFCELHWPGNL